MAELSKESIKNFTNRLAERDYAAPTGYLAKILKREYYNCSIEEQWVEYRVVMPEEARNVIGTIHGGYIAAIADEAMAITVLALDNNPDYTVTTMDMQFNTLKAMHVGEEIIIRCYVDHIGKRSAVSNCSFFRGSELCAMATETFARLKSEKVRFIDLKKL